MKLFNKIFSVAVCAAVVGFAQGAEEALPPGSVMLSDMGAENIGLQTVEADEVSFETTAFAIGRIEEVPSNHAVVSSRIAGRVIEVLALPGDQVEKGQVMLQVESRQPGDPPPVIPLKAPISGMVTQSHTRLGEPIDPSAEVFDVVDLSEVWAVARVPEHLAAQLQVGAQARIRVSAVGGTVFVGELLRFGTQANLESGTIDAVFRVPNPEFKMRPGMRAEFSIVLDARDDVLAVPRDALQGTPTDRFVFIRHIDAPNVYVKTPIVVGEMNDELVEVVSGLFLGDEVVTRGSYPLSYAGGGGVSLKEALDAAHGHEHNEDGSEMTAEQKKAKDAAKQAAAGNGGGGNPLLTRFLMIACGVLLVLLVVSVATRKPRD
ncbi:efflux RND transporter periplasmic adaptor subunit [Sulfuriroseicoccus oceanibius]|uniref:Efflux RND transporter periplasmic adaptor subunit n=1 Tax=Sulfuriroseicoccus oceanibius TaxID=2707525 RepID=A0A6B3L6D8_9BACT|nr:efflux RND transporter periplasmic adaptor subunit [Sulfuriroseicoccus oceanibius]QQL45783.1 efflux RND transporter periplasmic adaptor subunit [Sulfuriroseicoccus oceanibius]